MRKSVVEATSILVASALLVVIGLVVVPAVSSPAALRSNGRTYMLEVADTVAARDKGLGGRASLPANHGMLFIYSTEDIRCFWMKGMHFSLDMLWVGADKRLRFVQSDVSPNTYPQSFCPPVPAQYVIELDAGQVAQSGLRIGQKLNF